MGYLTCTHTVFVPVTLKSCMQPWSRLHFVLHFTVMNSLVIYILSVRPTFKKPIAHLSSMKVVGRNGYRLYELTRLTQISLVFHTCTPTQAYTLDIKIVQDQASAFYFKSLNSNFKNIDRLTAVSSEEY